MLRVAHWLKDIAETSASSEDVDLYGRSAFNRYYYAAYLLARDVIKETIPERVGAPHKNLPEVLHNTLFKRIKKDAAAAFRSRLLSERESKALINKARTAIQTMIEVLDIAYRHRITADYRPEIRLTNLGGVLRLESTTLSAAAKWPERAEQSKGQILNVWRQIGNS